MTEKVKIKLSVSTSKVGSECEDEFDIDKSEWDGMSDEEKREYLEDVYSYHRQNYVEGFAHAYDMSGNCLSEDI